ncbi:hypothetical protein ACFTS5_30020 [Nocardia sp. NPDC056952]|uniref:hypothetical protein n=1 Tax=Nocardia sp. NPDC056952 TaxID=3345979 RepID=UPI00363EF798
MTYEDYKSKVIAAQEQWNTERAKIYDRQLAGNYATIFGGDIQPPHITTPDNYDSMTLEQMQAAVAAMKPQLVDDAVTAWANIGGALMGTFTGFNQQFARTVTGAGGHSGWTGAAASAAVAAVNNYAQQSIPLSQAATAISLKLTEMRTGIEQTQALMPGLTERTNVTGKSLPADGVMKVDDHNRDEATQEGRRILRSVYSQVAGQTDNGVPFLPTAPTIADGGGPGSNSDTTAIDNQGDSTAADNESGDPAAGTPGDSATLEGSGTGSSATTTSSTDAGSTTPQSTTTTPQSTAPTTTPNTTAPTSAGATAPGVGTPGAGTPGTGAPGSGAPVSGRPTGSGPGGTGTQRGSGTPTSSAPGRSTPGNPSPAAATATGTRAGTSAAGGRGAAGVGGMGAPGAGRGNSDDERTKGIPDYLITQENGDLLLGADQIRTVPPVIGGDDDSAPR